MFVEVAQAVTAGSVGPFAPKRMAIVPAAIFDIIIGIKKGETRPGPRSLSFSVSLTNVFMPPMPEPTYTPSRSFSMCPDIPLSSTACAAAPMAYWAKRSVRRISLLSV